MTTCVLRLLAVIVVMATCVTFSSAQSRDTGTYYKPKHLQKHRGTLISPEDRGRPSDSIYRGSVMSPGPRPSAEVIPSGMDNDRELILEEDSRKDFALQQQPEYMMAMSPIPMMQYKHAMMTAMTHYDVFRIFVPQLSLTEEDIDRMMVTGIYPQSLSGHRTPISHVTQDDWAAWEATTLETHDVGRCGLPVPEIVHVRDIIGIGNVEYYPHCVLRYRCRSNAGCCPVSTQICAATSTHNVTKTILMAYVQNPTMYYTNQTLKSFTLENDTKCGCVDNPAPEEKCPYPFVFVYDSKKPHKCHCQPEFKAFCRRIRRGEAMFLDSDIKCMKDGGCRPLDNCDYGNFDTTTFQCPRSPQEDGSGYSQPTVREGRRGRG